MTDVPAVPAALVVIHKYSDMSDRARFVAKLDYKAHKLHAVLGEYDFDNLIHCGLSNCRQDHKHGVLVVTVDGTETNIGHVCGKKHFPDQFIGARNDFRARRKARAALEAVRDYQASTSGYLATIDELMGMPFGGHWVDECIRMYQSSCPIYIKNRLLGMARSGDWRITSEVRVAQDDNLGLGFRRDDLTVTEVLGVLRGGEALATNMRQLLLPMRVQIRRYAIVDLTRLPARKRAEWSDFATAIPPAIEKAKVTIRAAHEFFATENLQKLYLMVRDKHERRGVKRLIAAVEQLRGTSERLAS